MITLVSLPMFLAAAVSVTFFIFAVIFLPFMGKDEKTRRAFGIFQILSLVNTSYVLSFGVFLNLGKNLYWINIVNRIIMISSMFVIVVFFQLINEIFSFKKQKVLIVFYILSAVFSILITLNVPWFLSAQLVHTSSWYFGLKRGVFLNIWGIFINFLLLFSLIFLIIGLLQTPKEHSRSRKMILVLIFSSFAWIIVGILDAMTALQLIDYPPVSWIGSLSIVVVAAVILLNDFELKEEKITSLYEELIHDRLTGCYSKSYLELQLDKIMLKLKRGEQSGHYLIIFDMDDFKRINDQHGHLAGDFVLKKTIHTIQQLLRGSDILARFGGDEFLILVENTPPDFNIDSLIERLQQGVKKQKPIYQNQTLRVQCSFGGVYFDQNMLKKINTGDDIILFADEALYEAKKAGKNCFVLKNRC